MAPLGPITVATVSVTAVWAGRLEERFGIKVVGPIQAGLPPITVGHLQGCVSARSGVSLDLPQ